MRTELEKVLYFDPQGAAGWGCPRCGGSRYLPGLRCPRCERRDHP